MNDRTFYKEINELNLSFLPEELRNFVPIINDNFSKDKNTFSRFWENLNKYKYLFKKKKY